VTLIVGIKCSDGIVVAADGAATLGVMGQTTARQTTKKLNILSGSVVLGVSGPVGLAQRFEGEIEALWENKKLSGSGMPSMKPHEAMVIIRDVLWKHVEPELKAAQTAVNLVGHAAAAQSAICSAVVALPITKMPCLFQFNQQCSPEEATAKLPFLAIGSGQTIADPFLAFIRRIFWPDHNPTIGDGVFAALWTVKHAIQTAPGGIGDPIQIIIIERHDENWRARELVMEELQEHEEAIKYAEGSLARFRDSFHKPQDNEAPDTPPAPTPATS